MKRKNGFTLIELLAVIVILAIIALIATPIILGIVEDAKRDAFLRSVELVVSTTDMDIATKTFENNYTYTITDGTVSNLEIGIKNTEGMNGSIIYNKEGNEIYAIHNGKYCVKKTDGMEKAEISDYVEGECIIPKNLLKTLTNLVPNEGNIVTSTNGQLINLGEYGIRYQGKDPDNYIYFNCSDYSNQTLETCELWRIIGVVDGNVKIMRSTSIGSKEWDAKVCDKDGKNCVFDNNWSDASLQTYLNGEYYTSMITKNAVTGNVIQASTWYLRGYNTNSVTKDVMYNKERTGALYGSNPEKIENTNIGLMYPSDYGYAAMENDTCLATTILGSYSSCKASNWIAQLGPWEWLITPYSGNSYYAFSVYSGGSVRYSVYVSDTSAVRPVLYLTSYTAIGVGDGTQENPYTLSME